MLLEGGAIVNGVLIVLNRATSWVGSGYFIRKGVRERKKHYVFFALILSLVMFLLLWFFSLKNL